MNQQTFDLLSSLPFEDLDKLRSVLHSAAIKKGHKQPKLVLEEMSKIEGVIDKGLERHIPFSNVEIPEGYSQAGGYTVDIYVETEDVVYLIDPKGVGHNNNTPISDEVKKWVMAKQQVQYTKPDKEVRFILLKPSDVDNYEFNRLQNMYSKYGIELHITDRFLSNITGNNVNITQILQEKKHQLMIQNMKTLVGQPSNL